jgi:hypothetical protein
MKRTEIEAGSSWLARMSATGLNRRKIPRDQHDDVRKQELAERDFGIFQLGYQYGAFDSHGLSADLFAELWEPGTWELSDAGLFMCNTAAFGTGLVIKRK